MAAEALISFDNLAKVLQQYGEAIQGAYRGELESKGKNAGGGLYDSVKFSVVRGDTTYVVELSLADYWKWVEYGRNPGKFPPPDKILEWVRVKPVIPRPLDNGELPSEKSLAFLIGRKIAEKGIAPTSILGTASEDVYKDFYDSICDAITTDLEQAVNGALAGLATK